MTSSLLIGLDRRKGFWGKPTPVFFFPCAPFSSMMWTALLSLPLSHISKKTQDIIYISNDCLCSIPHHSDLKIAIHLLFCSVEVLSRLDDTYLYCYEGTIFTISFLNDSFFSPHDLRKTPRKNALPTSSVCINPIKLAQMISNHRY